MFGWQKHKYGIFSLMPGLSNYMWQTPGFVNFKRGTFLLSELRDNNEFSGNLCFGGITGFD